MTPMASRITGKANNTSINRIRIRSGQPPCQAAAIPIAPPIARAAATEATATANTVR